MCVCVCVCFFSGVDSIFGHLLLENQRGAHTIFSLNVLVTHIFFFSLHLLDMISFVRVAYTLPLVVSIYSTPMMFSGMVRAVHPTAHAVSSTTLHGL